MIYLKIANFYTKIPTFFLLFFSFDDCPCKQMPSTKQCLISHVRTVFPELPYLILVPYPPPPLTHLVTLWQDNTKKKIQEDVFFSVIFLSKDITVCLRSLGTYLAVLQSQKEMLWQVPRLLGHTVIYILFISCLHLYEKLYFTN